MKLRHYNPYWFCLRSFEVKEFPYDADIFYKGIKMGAYVDNKWCACESWKRVARKRQKLILGPQYRNVLHDECIIAVMFGDNAPLLEKILAISLPSEIEYIIELFTNEVDIEFINGNLVISN